MPHPTFPTVLMMLPRRVRPPRFLILQLIPCRLFQQVVWPHPLPRPPQSRWTRPRWTLVMARLPASANALEPPFPALAATSGFSPRRSRSAPPLHSLSPCSGRAATPYPGLHSRGMPSAFGTMQARPEPLGLLPIGSGALPRVIFPVRALNVAPLAKPASGARSSTAVCRDPSPDAGHPVRATLPLPSTEPTSLIHLASVSVG